MKRVPSLCLGLVLCGLLLSGSSAQRGEAQPTVPLMLQVAAVLPVQAKDVPKVVYQRGRVVDPLAQAGYHAAAIKRHGNRVALLANRTDASFDCRTAFKNVLPVDDQGSCGDCFGVSSADGASMALILAGQLPLDTSKGRLSSQYGLDYRSAFQGGCNGGDEAQVLDYLKTTGFPLTSDYGEYTASPGRPKDVSGMKMWKIADYGYCTPNQQSGIASTQDMKNCMVRYGPLSVAFDAGECNGYTWPGTMTGRGTGVDHAVLCIGWDDNHDNGDGSKGAFLGMNQWGAGWGGPGGTFWIKYGADSWGTEAMWITGSTLPPPPPGPPVPPQPVPSGAPAISSTLMAVAALNVPFTYQITASNAPTAFAAAGLPNGLTCNAAGLIAGTTNAAAATYQVELSATNASGVGTATLALTVSTAPVPPAPGKAASVAIAYGDGSTQTLYAVTGEMSLRQIINALDGKSGTLLPSREPPLLPYSLEDFRKEQVAFNKDILLALKHERDRQEVINQRILDLLEGKSKPKP